VLGNQFGGKLKVKITERERAGGNEGSRCRHDSGLDRPVQMKNGLIVSRRFSC
jgi:hypothetical protein